MPVFMVTFIKGLKVKHQPILPPYCAIYLVRHGALIRHFLIRIGFATFQQLQWIPGVSMPIANLGHAVIDCDGLDFFVKSTFGINKTI